VAALAIWGGLAGCARQSPQPPVATAPPVRATADVTALEKLHPLYPELVSLSRRIASLPAEPAGPPPAAPTAGWPQGIPAPETPALPPAPARPKTPPLGEAVSAEMARAEAAESEQLERSLVQQEAELEAEIRLGLDDKRRQERQRAEELEESAVRAARDEINRLAMATAISRKPAGDTNSEELLRKIQQDQQEARDQLAAAKARLTRQTEEIAQAQQEAVAQYKRNAEADLQDARQKHEQRRRELQQQAAASRKERQETLRALLRDPPETVEFGALAPSGGTLQVPPDGRERTEQREEAYRAALAERAADIRQRERRRLQAQCAALQRRIRGETLLAAQAAALRMGKTLRGPRGPDTPPEDITGALAEQLRMAWPSGL
jgi:hypothetical protein